MKKTYQDAILTRISRRKFDTGDLPQDVIKKIIDIISQSKTGPLGNELEFTLVKKNSDENKRLKLGTYGFITGAGYFIAGQVLPGKKAFLDYAYVLEKIILDLSLLNLGTCWLGGTFDRGEFAKSIGLKNNYVIPAITPVGYATESRGLGERVIRFGAGSKKRKPAESLFFEDNPGKPFDYKGNDDQVAKMLEMVRLGPSASNNQPWRIIIQNNLFHFHLQRKPGYGFFGKVDLQMIDMGIAMCHFDLTAKEMGKNPVWEISGEPVAFDEWEYVITAKI